MRLNSVSRASAVLRTAEGAPASAITPEQQLMRAVMTCLLWERNAYSSGQSVADIIAANVPKVSPEFAAATAYYARTDMKLRHVPLLVMREMARHAEHRKLLGRLMPDVIQRPDEITEFMAIYWKDKPGAPLAKQVKVGLAKAFAKFSEFQLAKWNREGAVRLRDVMFLVHAKPADAQPGRYTKAERKDSQNARLLARGEETFKMLADDTLPTPPTWEKRLSSGEDKKTVWESMLREKQLGAQAFLMNLRNMDSVGVDDKLIRAYAQSVNIERVLPYQFMSAGSIMPKFRDMLEPMMFRCLDGVDKLRGKTVLLVDVSGSMDAKLSSKGEMTRMDAACGLAVLLREQCPDGLSIYSFSSKTVGVKSEARGFGLADAIMKSQQHASTYLGEALSTVQRLEKEYDRIIVITDEQSHDRVPDPRGRGYVINVAAERNGVGYGPWMHIDGWSEKVFDYIKAHEAEPVYALK